MRFRKEEIQAARNADLYGPLLRRHWDEFYKEGNWLRMKKNPSICLKRGCGGYKDYATLETGNSIDFLERHMHYDFLEAVAVLMEERAPSANPDPPNRDVILPHRAVNNNVASAYLAGRGIVDFVIKQLEEEGLLYQDVNRNVVFRSKDGNFYEIRGTWPGKRFHRCGKRNPDCFWSFIPGGHPKRAFICESAIDAVSLYQIHLQTAEDTDNAYCGIAGVANQQAIERIRKWLPSVLAVDNDDAGEQCRRRNHDIPAVIPQNKDWNEDLMTLSIEKKEEIENADDDRH